MNALKGPLLDEVLTEPIGTAVGWILSTPPDRPLSLGTTLHALQAPETALGRPAADQRVEIQALARVRSRLFDEVTHLNEQVAQDQAQARARIATLRNEIARLDAQAARKKEILTSLAAFPVDTLQTQLADLERRLNALSDAVSALEFGPARLSVATGPRSVHVDIVNWIKSITGFGDERVADLVGVSRRTLNNWRLGTPIRVANRRRLLETRDVLERAFEHYPTPENLAVWLDTPVDTSGRTPTKLLQEGHADQARLFAIGGPAPQVAPTPDWARQVKQSTGTEARRIAGTYFSDEEVPGYEDDLDLDAREPHS
jgi:hypothetical protein